MSPLPEDDRHALLELARRAITAAVARQPAPPLPILSSNVSGCGAFVSLHRHGRLRGCIGLIESSSLLTDTIARCAVSAALEDPRFDPLTAAELAGLEVEISVLSPLVTARPEEVEVGRHGLRIRQGYFSGLLLPQVASKYNWSRERFLAETCRKAGLHPEAWREPDTRLEIFTAEVFSEADVPAEKKMPANS
jgi:AmmeMemoRadiSam system protein A